MPLVARRSLLQHPFYLAWSDGTLPVPALKEYAHDYGAFIRTVGQGWEAVGENAHRRGRARPRAGLGEHVCRRSGNDRRLPRAPPKPPRLVDAARELFADRTTALGALYAFESQQPYTAQSKLAGLREHYQQLPACCGEYFRLHEDDFDEPALARRARWTRCPPTNRNARSPPASA